jgi:hypothetical protein
VLIPSSDHSFFAGFDWHASGQFLVATPEKAVVNCLYICGRRGKRFGFLPELELPWSFRFGLARDWASRIEEPRVRAYVCATSTTRAPS